MTPLSTKKLVEGRVYIDGAWRNGKIYDIGAELGEELSDPLLYSGGHFERDRWAFQINGDTYFLKTFKDSSSGYYPFYLYKFTPSVFETPTYDLSTSFTSVSSTTYFDVNFSLGCTLDYVVLCHAWTGAPNYYILDVFRKQIITLSSGDGNYNNIFLTESYVFFYNGPTGYDYPNIIARKIRSGTPLSIGVIRETIKDVIGGAEDVVYMHGRNTANVYKIDASNNSITTITLGINVRTFLPVCRIKDEQWYIVYNSSGVPITKAMTLNLSTGAFSNPGSGTFSYEFSSPQFLCYTERYIYVLVGDTSDYRIVRIDRSTRLISVVQLFGQYNWIRQFSENAWANACFIDVGEITGDILLKNGYAFDLNTYEITPVKTTSPYYNEKISAKSRDSSPVIGVYNVTPQDQRGCVLISSPVVTSGHAPSICVTRPQSKKILELTD